MVTVTGFQLGRLLAGTVVIENIFMVPGMGKLLLDSVFHRDYTEVQAIVVLITVSVLILNLLLDVIYGWLNPRIRYS